jgi:hypothetical protein
MDPELDAVMRDVRTLMDEVRLQCLWFMREDWYPSTPHEAIRVLGSIERNADMATFRRAATLRQWLSRRFSASSAV